AHVAKASGIESSSAGRLASFIQSGNNLLENIVKNVNKQACKMSFKSKLNKETRNVVFELLKGAAEMNWVGVGLCVVGYVLDQVDKVSANKDQCIQLLKYMCGLAKHVKELVGHMPQEKLNNVVVFIVRGSLLCVSQMQSNDLSRFFSASVTVSDLESVQSQLGKIYPDLTLGAVIGILNKMPTAPPASQGIYPDADNPLRGSDLEKLLPGDLSILPEYSRILLTTRKLDETAMLQRSTIKRYDYSVNTLTHAEAKKLLSALTVFLIMVWIPLVVELVGSKLREHADNISACNQTVSF
ncbi:hypothetical protein KI387_034065, partial [Taxus chinensis]